MGTLKTVGNTGTARAETGSPDIFDVPSEDEVVTRPVKPTKKLSAKQRTPEQDFDVPLSEDEAPVLGRKPVKTVAPPRKAQPAKTAASAPKKLQKSVQSSKPEPASQTSANAPIAPRLQRGKTPQPTQMPKQSSKDDKLVQRSREVTKSGSRAATPTLSVTKASGNKKASSVPPSRKALAKRPSKPSENLDVFDIPLSDDDAPVPKPRPSREAPPSIVKKLAKTTGPAVGSSHNESAESDDSNASKKRKRQGSVSSISTVKPSMEGKQEPSLPQRSRKYQKNENSTSPRHKSPEQTIASIKETQPQAPVINKPNRTRIRTVPVLTRPTIAKGQSSPATLNSMLPGRQQPQPSPISEVPEVTVLEDATMYEILDTSTTPVRAPKATTSGSVTPRQKALFSSLLGESPIGTTPMPKISALQLNERKPTSLLGALSRSKSDLTYSAQTRKTRLIDTIKRAESSSDEDEDEDEDSASDEEPEERGASGRLLESSQTTRPSADIPHDHMDIDTEVAADSQTSQTSFGQRQRLTYANARSYLQEANPEDDLLISMDLDDNLGLERDNVTEDEEDLSSQVRARHELKRRGQQAAFQWETQTSIDDISSQAGNSVRRNAMMEFCTKMADHNFTSQLLDSSLVHQFFKNASSNGEIVFDFATAVAFIFILETNPTYTLLDQIHGSGIVSTLVKLSSNATDIQRIAKDRKTNLSKIALESVGKFRTLVQSSPIWASTKPEKVSPQLVALKALELLMVGMRSAGSTALLVDQDEISQLVDVTLQPAERRRSGTASSQDVLVLDLIISILEAVSGAKQKQSAWPTGTLQRLANAIPVFFQPGNAGSAILAVKLCMNLTNNKPKACQPFSGPTFVQPLVSSITRNFGLLGTGIKVEQRTEVLETLILSLGAMINLAEFSDQARLNIDDGAQMIGTLVKIFLDGSERAAQVCSQLNARADRMLIRLRLIQWKNLILGWRSDTLLFSLAISA